jgi:transcriptional regulator with XRE-family HTH domain
MDRVYHIVHVEDRHYFVGFGDSGAAFDVASLDKMEYSVFVTVNEAIATMRTKLGLNRNDFAVLARISAKMVYRLENGQTPSSAALVKLAQIAKVNHLVALENLFEATRRANISARVETVSTTGRARRVTKSDLKHWSAVLYTIKNELLKLYTTDLYKIPTPVRDVIRTQAIEIDYRVRDEIEMCIGEPITAERLYELEHPLPRLPRTRSTQKGTK